VSAADVGSLLRGPIGNAHGVNFLFDPWSWWVEPFIDNPFMRSALWAGLLTVVTTSVVGIWVVLRGLSFLGDALAHGVLPGIAIAFIIGVDTGIGAFIAAMVMVLGVTFIRSNSPLPEDTSIGILFVGFLALAVVIMSSGLGSYAGDLNRFLFGSITGTTSAGITRQALVAAGVVVATVIFYRAFLVMTFDEIQARILKMRPRIAHIGLLAMLAISIVASFETVGSLLVMAFLIAPPATAAIIAHRVPVMIALAVMIGFIAVVTGLLVSYHHRTAAGATMALVAVVLFFIALLSNMIHAALTGHREIASHDSAHTH
jgi:ABC-type Mn2+/Zn2+ transport system permease subunit